MRRNGLCASDEDIVVVHNARIRYREREVGIFITFRDPSSDPSAYFSFECVRQWSSGQDECFGYLGTFLSFFATRNDRCRSDWIGIKSAAMKMCAIQKFRAAF
jgi:hypothetical protein